MVNNEHILLGLASGLSSLQRELGQDVLNCNLAVWNLDRQGNHKMAAMLAKDRENLKDMDKAVKAMLKEIQGMGVALVPIRGRSELWLSN